MPKKAKVEAELAVGGEDDNKVNGDLNSGDIRGAPDFPPPPPPHADVTRAAPVSRFDAALAMVNRKNRLHNPFSPGVMSSKSSSNWRRDSMKQR